ncbi:MAG: hypothetical protein SLAVMIC_00010 [uncultured marine phage]|uniref:Uncharacterized protein n=1 Tax=uncultured marine phage TaxID=707152 RepID=A0A8D9FRS3_9VIRU|nr:MAG: hypothetical protein SLAVMIC_00010 [uncultured marine phage]
MNFKFNICVGVFKRKIIREKLQHSILTIQYNFPDSTMILKEEKALLNSKFYISGTNLPDRESIVNFINNVWITNIKKLDTENEES